MGKPIKRAPQSKLAKLEASVSKWRSKALSLQWQTATLQKLVTALYSELVHKSVQAGESGSADNDASAWPKQAMAVLMTPTTGHTKSYTEIEAKLRAGGVPIPPSLAMLAAAERGDSDDPRIAALKLRPKLYD